jgi:hypothetical protein
MQWVYKFRMDLYKDRGKKVCLKYLELNIKYILDIQTEMQLSTVRIRICKGSLLKKYNQAYYYRK